MSVWRESEDLFFCKIFLGASLSASSLFSAPDSNMETTELRADRDQKLLPSLSFRSNTTEAFLVSFSLTAAWVLSAGSLGASSAPVWLGGALSSSDISH